MSIPDRIKALINIAGQTVTIRELTSLNVDTGTMTNSPVYTDHVVKASIRDFRDSELAGLVQKGDRELKVAAKDLGSYVPKQNDKVLVGTKQFNVKSVNILTAKNEDAMFELVIRG